MYSFHVTFPDKKTAVRIVRLLVKERLAACANIFPCTSVYRWKGKLHQHEEFVAIVKCPSTHLKKIEKRILALHPYEVPAILWHSEGATSKYANWVKKSAKK